GSADYALQIQAQQTDRRCADLHRRIELEDDRDLRSPGQSVAPSIAAAATVSRSSALCSQWQDDCGCAGPAWPHLRALQRHDDAQDPLEYFRAPDHRAAGTFGLFC